MGTFKLDRLLCDKSTVTKLDEDRELQSSFSMELCDKLTVRNALTSWKTNGSTRWILLYEKSMEVRFSASKNKCAESSVKLLFDANKVVKFPAFRNVFSCSISNPTSEMSNVCKLTNISKKFRLISRKNQFLIPIDPSCSIKIAITIYHI